MVTEVSTQQRKPVYIAYKTFLTALDTLEPGIPPEITSRVWPTFSGSLQAQTFSAFKFLGLIDENGKTQPILQDLVNAKGDEKKAIIQKLLKDKYSEAVKLGEDNGTLQQLQELIRNKGLSGGTMEMAIRFFTDACSAAGLKCSPHWANTKRTRRIVLAGRGERQSVVKGETKSLQAPVDKVVDKPKPPDDLGLHPMLLGLIRELPPPNSVLDKQKRDSLQQYFSVVLDILYKKNDVV